MQTLQNENFRLPEDVTTLIRIGVQLVCIILDQRIVFQFIVKKKKKEGSYSTADKNHNKG